jgi:CBS domain-containing protein
MSIVSFARLYALQQNLIETNTIARLEAITRVGMLLDSKRRDIVTAYESLLRFRLWNQILAIKQNRQPDNWIDPGQLGHIEEVILLECFREIDELQNRIGRDFLGG